jgi:hypothetical protein
MDQADRQTVSVLTSSGGSLFELFLRNWVFVPGSNATQSNLSQINALFSWLALLFHTINLSALDKTRPRHRGMQQHDVTSRDVTIVCSRAYSYIERGPKIVSENPEWTSWKTTSLTTINSSPIDVWGKLQRMFCLQQFKAAIRSQPFAKGRQNPSARQTLL